MMSLSGIEAHPDLSRNLIPSGHLNLMGTIKTSEANDSGCRAIAAGKSGDKHPNGESVLIWIPSRTCVLAVIGTLTGGHL